MKNSNGDDSKFWQVLEKNRLVDLSQFHKRGFYEEVPLYSRLSDISFLSDLSSDEASVLLLRFALKFLKSVISYEEHQTPYFAAITVSDFSTKDPIVPNLFVWFESVSKLYPRLTLRAVTTPFGKKIKRLVSRLRLPESFEVVEDTITIPDLPRVFIAPSLPPYQNFVPVYMFCKSNSA